jgi:hypothetical protein
MTLDCATLSTRLPDKSGSAADLREGIAPKVVVRGATDVAGADACVLLTAAGSGEAAMTCGRATVF